MKNGVQNLGQNCILVLSWTLLVPPYIGMESFKWLLLEVGTIQFCILQNCLIKIHGDGKKLQNRLTFWIALWLYLMGSDQQLWENWTENLSWLVVWNVKSKTIFPIIEDTDFLCFYMLIICSNFVDVETSNSECKNLFQKLFWPFTVKINCFSNFENCCLQPKEQYFITGFSKQQFRN